MSIDSVNIKRYVAICAHHNFSSFRRYIANHVKERFDHISIGITKSGKIKFYPAHDLCTGLPGPMECIGYGADHDVIGMIVGRITAVGIIATDGRREDDGLAIEQRSEETGGWWYGRWVGAETAWR